MKKLEKYFLQINDLVIGMDGSKVGKNSALITDKDSGALLIQRVARLRTECKATISFIFQHINSIKFHSYVDRINTSSGIPHISAKQINEFEICFPPVEKEQQKIADCLTSIDELVTAQTQKIEALKAHKKGLMQQLFPAEGETVPKLRFPEFRGAGEWINSTLGDISKITSGGTPSRTKNEYWNGNIPWVTTSLIDFNIIQSANEFISELGLKESSAKIFPKNTILMAMYGQGITRGKVAVLGIDAATNQACAAILLNEEIKPSFVFQNLVSRYDEIRDLSNQGGQENLSGGLIEKIPFSFPASVDEQQKIANCLSSIDELIIAQTQKLTALKAHKKGLMQQLFPSMDDDCMDATTKGWSMDSVRATQDAKAEMAR